MTAMSQPRRCPVLALVGRLGAAGLLLASAGCQLLSQTPDPDRRSAIRERVAYGLSAAEASSRLSGLGFGCSRRSGEYLDEAGKAREADHLLFCVERPGAVSFACQNRDQVTVVLRDDQVSGIEVRRGPSCDQTSPEALKIK
jgi:hypothetical protein